MDNDMFEMMVLYLHFPWFLALGLAYLEIERHRCYCLALIVSCLWWACHIAYTTKVYSTVSALN